VSQVLGFDTQMLWAQGLGRAEGGELRLRPLREAISKVSKGCTLTESVTWKKIYPPTQGPNLELGLSSGSRN